jgi:hypothetical protein
MAGGGVRQSGFSGRGEAVMPTHHVAPLADDHALMTAGRLACKACRRGGGGATQYSVRQSDGVRLKSGTLMTAGRTWRFGHRLVPTAIRHPFWMSMKPGIDHTIRVMRQFFKA